MRHIINFHAVRCSKELIDILGTDLKIVVLHLAPHLCYYNANKYIYKKIPTFQYFEFS